MQFSNIFPNFDADENDPASYDFACTDEAILVCLDAGTETFYRLGQTIENQIKKHHTLPPKDFKKWAMENNADDYLTFKEPELNKTSIKKALANGAEIPHLELVERKYLCIK